MALLGCCNKAYQDSVLAADKALYNNFSLALQKKLCSVFQLLLLIRSLVSHFHLC